MSGLSKSGIDWCDAVWNPVTGCTPCSAGCDHCYARTMAETRLRGQAGYPEDEPFRVTLHPERLDAPWHARKPRVIFVNSMGDLFHEDVPERFIRAVLGIISSAQDHVFVVLTKRPDRMARVMRGLREGFLEKMHEALNHELPRSGHAHLRVLCDAWPLPNLILGVTAENQDAAYKRLCLLLDTPAACRVVSVEPMLGEVVLPRGLDWVICGGESGPGARPMHPGWVRRLRDQCYDQGVPFFFKQWGKRAAGHLIDGHALRVYPELIQRMRRENT